MIGDLVINGGIVMGYLSLLVIFFLVKNVYEIFKKKNGTK